MGLGIVDGLPEFIRFSLSGCIGTLLDFLAYRYIYDSNIFPMYRATLSWASAYALSVIWQHALHAFFVFGGFGPTGYFRSLATMYMAYSASILFSPVINWCLINHVHMMHQFAFLATLIITGVLNYVLLSKSMGGQNTPALVILAGGIPVNDYMMKNSPNAKTQPDRRVNDAHGFAKRGCGTVIIGAPTGQGGCSIC